MAEIYEKRGMFNEAAKRYGNAAEFALRPYEKADLNVKEAQLYIKSGSFDQADFATKKAITNTRDIDKKEDVKSIIRDIYLKEGERLEKEQKKAQAIKVYEKMLSMNLSVEKKNTIKKKLVGLYEGVGRFKDHFKLKGNLEGRWFFTQSRYFFD